MLPSQEYSFQLVREAVLRGATIVIMRSETRWMRTIAELNGYQRALPLSNPQAPFISQKNCGDRWDLVLEAIGANATG